MTDRPTAHISAPGELPEPVRIAVGAAQDKNAFDVVVLDLRESRAFTDFFVVCSAQSTRQIQAIVNSVEEQLRAVQTKPSHTEGYDHSEWVVMDYFDFIVHVFTHETRLFYALERLWGSASRIEFSQPA